MPSTITEPEFNDWVEFHGSLYVGFADWMAKNFNALVLWYEALADFTIHELRAASKIHIRRPNAEKATSYGNQLADLLEILRGKKTQESYSAEMGRYAHVCGLCNGSGMVFVRGKDGYQFTTTGSFPLGHVQDRTKCVRGAHPADVGSASVACKCQAGDRFRVRFPTFDAKCMEVPRGPGRGRCQDIIQGLRDKGRVAEANSYQRFLDGKLNPKSLIASAMAVPAGGEG